jgi:hypothetical protein
MSSLLAFGDRIDGYAVPVLNERAVRASAGLLFLFAIVAFMHAWLLGDFQPTRVFVGAFLVDFTIRIFVNPHYAPSLVVGQWIVRRQQPEYVGAPQKRFAWAIGFVLALVMLWLVVIQRVIGPVNLLVCAACLTLLFFEAAFGICLGCKVYNLLHEEQAQLCPGGVCATEPAPASHLGWGQGAVLAAFVALVGATGSWVGHQGTATAAARAGDAQPTAAAQAPLDPAEAERCKVPDFAKAMGHEEKWKLHNNCR